MMRACKLVGGGPRGRHPGRLLALGGGGEGAGAEPGVAGEAGCGVAARCDDRNRGCFAWLKTEHVHLVRFGAREEARAAVFAHIELFYNRQRSHSAGGYRAPAGARASMEGITKPVAA